MQATALKHAPANPVSIDHNDFAERLSHVFNLPESTARLYIRRLKESGLLPKGEYSAPGIASAKAPFNLSQAICILTAFMCSDTAGNAPQEAFKTIALEQHKVTFETSEAVSGKQRRDLKRQMRQGLEAQTNTTWQPDTSGIFADDMARHIALWLDGRNTQLPDVEIVKTPFSHSAAIRFPLHQDEQSKPFSWLRVQYGEHIPSPLSVSQSSILPASALKAIFQPFRKAECR